jgi:hypothetical protein
LTPSSPTPRENKKICSDLDQLARSMQAGSEDRSLVERASNLIHDTTRALELCEAYFATTEAMRKGLNRRLYDIAHGEETSRLAWEEEK